MKHVLYIQWTGDYQGTAIERKLKDYILQKYAGNVCSEDAAEAIYKDILEECNRLCEIAPRCKRPELIFSTPEYLSDGYSIRFKDCCGLGNRSLISFKIARTMYITSGQTLFDAVEDVTEVEE